MIDLKLNDKILVPVLSSDIKRGIKADCQKCPIALAVKRKLKTTHIVSVTGYRILIVHRTLLRDFIQLEPTDHNKHEYFLQMFDHGERALPISLLYKVTYVFDPKK